MYKTRYARVSALKWMDFSKIKSILPIIVGCGMNGSQIAMSLATMGIPEMILIDPDRLAPTDLGKTFYSELAAEVGMTKVTGMKQLLHQMNSSLKISTFAVKFEKFSKGIVLDLLTGGRQLLPIVAVDNRRTSLIASRFFNLLGLNCFVCSASPGLVKSQVYILKPGGGCYACSFEPSDFELMHQQFSCLQNRDSESGIPAMQSIAAQCAAELIHEFLFERLPGLKTFFPDEIRNPEESFERVYSPFQGRWIKPLQKSAICRYHYPPLKDCLEIPQNRSLGDLFDLISRQPGENESKIWLDFLFQNARYHLRVRCPDCYGELDWGKLTPNNGTCPHCRHEISMFRPVRYSESVNSGNLPPALKSIPVSELPILEDDAVLAYSEKHSYLIRIKGE